MLTEIPAADQTAVGAKGINNATAPSAAHTRHTRARAATGSMPSRTQRKETQPPANPPTIAAKGGSQANQAASTKVRWCTATRYSVVQFVQSEYVIMLIALASTYPQMRRSRRMSRLLATGSAGVERLERATKC